MSLSGKTLLAAVLIMTAVAVGVFVALPFYLSSVYKTGPFATLYGITGIACVSAVSAAVLVLAPCVYIFILRKTYITRINVLTKRSDQIGETGDFTSRLPVKYDDEISRLAWSFNALLDRMAESNYTLEENIKDSSRMLEKTIKERLSALMSMNQVLTLMEQVFDHSLEGIIITDADALIIKVNPAFTSITGYSGHEVIGKNPRILKSDHHNPHFYREMWEVLVSEGHWSGEIWNRHRDGNAFPEWLSISAIRNAEGKTSHYVGVFHDISDDKRQEELIRYQAFHDSLTGLPNRFLLKNRVEQSILRSSRDKNKFGVIFLGLDNFKKINESLGHAIGDMLLKDAAERLRDIARNVDTVARHGGDEFIILVEEIVDEKPLITLAQRILVSFREPFKILETVFNIGISMGIAIYPQDGEDYDILLRNADTAMYRAKDLGRETFAMYTTSLNTSVSRNLKLENDLRKALVDKTFEVHYQPQMDLKTGKIIGVEGLARWTNSGDLVMPPEGFIPFSEKTNLIFEIDRIVMGKALVEIGGLINTGHCPLKLSLNCSAKVLHLKRLPNIIAGYFSKYNFDPEWFELEITETSIMKNFKESLDIISRLKETGISISLDDFGTGYSSLAQLRNLPVNSLKIDRSFVEELSSNKGDANIIEAIVSLAQKFGLKVIAEGVETEEQFQFVKSAGCDIVQGYYISRPLPLDRLKAFLEVYKDNSI